MEILALSVAVPKNVLDNSEIEEKFGTKKAKKVQKVTGVNKRHVATEDIRALELMMAAANSAIDKSGGDKNFDAVIVVSQTAEYKFPATACILQDKLGLPKSVMAYDINLGCSGFAYGMVTSNALLKSGLFKKILLVAGELTQSTASEEDCATYPLFGDAFSAGVLVAGENENVLATSFGTDGSGAENLITYIGGSRYRNFEEYNAKKGQELQGIVNYPEYVYMNGAEIFRFSVDVVEEMLSALLKDSGLNRQEVDYFVLHQANEFIIKHITNKLELPQDKVLMSIGDYGNTSGASIPLTLCLKFGDDKSVGLQNVMCMGFGVGYSWAGLMLKVKPEVIHPIIEV